MNSTASNPDPLAMYTELRRSIEDLQRQFSEAAEQTPFLHHQMIFSPREPLNNRAWESFAAAYETTFLDGFWEDWDISTDGIWCGHWYGTRRWYDRFQTMSVRGLEILKGIKEIVDTRGGLPEGVVLTLPESDDRHGWLDWIYRTAEFGVEPLYIHGHRWNLDDGTDSDEAEDLMYNSWSAGDAAGIKYPEHPYFLTVGQDLFRASAAMISIWLDPERYPDGGDRLTATLPVELPVATPGPIRREREELTEETSQQVPRYDEDTRGLYLGQNLQKSFRQPASLEEDAPYNQETLVMEFDCAKWPRRIKNPFKDLESGTLRKRVLIQTIFDFNNYVRERGGHLRFRTVHNSAEWYIKSSSASEGE